MKFPVKLPEFKAEEPHVEMVMLECRVCNKQSSWYWDTTSSDPNRDEGIQAAYEWQRQHNTHTGHRNFYRWAIQRNTGRIVTL